MKINKIKIFDKLFFKQRNNIIETYFNGIEYATEDYNQEVYKTWYVDLKTNIGIIFGIISVIVSVVSILITFL